MRAMWRRRVIRPAGFTLVEVTVGLVLAGVVALLAYGALSTATDTRDRLAEGRLSNRSEEAWRDLIRQSLREARSGMEYAGATLLVEGGTDAGGRPSDRLTVLTSWGGPPLSPGVDWEVVFHTEDGRMVAEARALPGGQDPGTASSSPVRRIPGPVGITGMEVEALPGGRVGWVDTWRPGQGLPYGVRVTLWTEDGPRAAPLVVSLPLGGTP